jgi:hypothetical protein
MTQVVLQDKFLRMGRDKQFEKRLPSFPVRRLLLAHSVCVCLSVPLVWVSLSVCVLCVERSLCVCVCVLLSLSVVRCVCRSVCVS